MRFQFINTLFLSISFFAVEASAAPGDIDASFGTNGVVTTSFPGGSAASAVAVQADGRIVIAGYATPSYASSPVVVARYNTNGSLDNTFGSGGKVTASFNFSHSLSGIAIQADGKIVVVGDGGSDDGEFLIARFQPNGAIDTAFGENGVVLVEFGNDEWASDLVIQPDGRIVIAGASSNDKFAVARLNVNGSLDSSFGVEGRVTTTLGGQASTVGLQQDGKIIVAGSNGSGSFVLVRYNADGTLDTEFDGDGIAITPLAGSGVRDLAIQPDGKAVVTGSLNTGFAVARYNTNGSLDQSFETDGVAITPIPGYNGGPFSISVQPNGKLVVAGSVELYNSIDFYGVLVRYDPTGSLDPTFGGDGMVVFTVATDTDFYCHAIQPDGKIVVGGYDAGRVMVARFIGDVIKKPFDFDADGRSDISVFRPSNNTWYVLNTAGYSSRNFGADGDVAAPADYDGDGKTDIAIWRPSNGQWYMLTSGGQYQVVAWGESGDLPVPADHDGDGRDDHVLYRPSNDTWYIRFASGAFLSRQFGAAGDRPVSGDFDGNGNGDLAVVRPSSNTWYVQNSAGFSAREFGEAGDVAVPADYDGDGRTDIAVFRPSTGRWYWMGSAEGFRISGQWGVEGDIPVPGDYDGDGRADPAVFRPSNGNWYIVGTSAGITVRPFGQAGDRPAANAFIY